MKAQRNGIGKMGGLLLTFLVASIFITTTSCQKDDLLSNGTASSTDNIARVGIEDGVQVDPILSIRHESARTAAHDYIFTVYPTGKAKFVGIRNVAVVGQRSVEVTHSQYNEFLELMAKSNFFAIQDNNQWTPDLPLTVTTYTPNSTLPTSNMNAATSKSLVDFNNGTPLELYRLRTTIEKIFNISELVGPDRGEDIVSSSPPVE